MKKIIFSFICLLVTFSCAIDGPELPPLGSNRYILLNPDSTSVITSSGDKILVEYKDKTDGVIRRHYKVFMTHYFADKHAAWVVNDTVYSFWFEHINADSFFITCKGRIDTLVEMQLSPLDLVFNNERIYEPNYDWGLVFLVR